MRCFVLTFLFAAQALKLVPQGDKASSAYKAKEAHTVRAVLKERVQETFDTGLQAVELARKAVWEGLNPSDFAPELTKVSQVSQESTENVAHIRTPEEARARKEMRQAQRAVNRSMDLLKVVFIGCIMLAAGIIACMYYQRGAVTVISIAGYLISLCTMSNMIRNIFVNYDFNYPQFVTALHALCSCIVGFVILQHREKTTGAKITFPTVATLLKGLGPVAFCFALNLGCANLALLHSNTHFYEMFSATNILCTFGLGALLGRPTSPKLLPPLLLVSVAVGAVAFGEMRFSVLGCAFIFASVLFRGFKAQLQSMLMAPGVMSQTFDPIELVCWTSALTFVIMMTWSAINEGFAPWRDFDEIGVIGAVGLSCVNAVILNTAGLFVMKEVGPLGQQVIGEMKGILACLGAVAVFGEIITLQQIIGYSLVVVGAQWYNRCHMQVQEEEREAKDKVQASTAKA